MDYVTVEAWPLWGRLLLLIAVSSPIIWAIVKMWIFFWKEAKDE